MSTRSRFIVDLVGGVILAFAVKTVISGPNFRLSGPKDAAPARITR